MQTMSEPVPLDSAERLKEQLRFDYAESGAPPVFRDPAFMENRQVPVHRWVPWIAGFSSTFVEDCFSAFLKKPSRRKCRVLDPFAGVGTTIVSALKAGHDAFGFEINPYAALACQAKATAISIDLAEFDAAIDRYAYASRNGSRVAVGQKPEGFESRIQFFSPQVEEQVFGFLAFLESVSSPAMRTLFKIAFGSVMVSFSNYTYEPSLSTRPGAGKPLILEADVHASILLKLRTMRSDTEQLQKVAQVRRAPTATIHCMDFMDSEKVLKADFIDLAVTSPPYLNNYHYIRSTRPHLYWLGLVEQRSDLRALEELNVGKYWQTVRGQKPIDLAFRDENLEKVIGAIRETRTDKGVYGGGGWANYAASYFNDSDRFLSSLSRALVPGGMAVIVVGNSIIQGHEIKVEEILARMAPRHALHLHSIEELRTKRVGASITKSAVRRGETSTASLYESAVILRRGKGG
jgi:hypothetical protein